MQRAQSQDVTRQLCWITMAGAAATAALSLVVGGCSAAPVVGVVLALVIGFCLSKQPVVRVTRGTVHIDRGFFRAPQSVPYAEVQSVRQDSEREVVLVTQAGEVTLPVRAVESADSKTVRRLLSKLVD